MDIFQNFSEKISNPVVVENLSEISMAGLVAFIIAFLTTPLVAKFAGYVGAIDLPPKLRGKSDETSKRRIHTEAKYKLGGIAMFLGLFVTLMLTNSLDYFSTGAILGLIIIFAFGLLDDIYEIDSKVSLAGQLLAAFAFVLGGSTILLVDFRVFALDLNLYSDLVFNIGNHTYNFIFPADIFTMIWIVGLINVVSWSDGADGVAGSISSMAALFMLLVVLARGDIALAIIISIFIGSILGVLPYNYNPSKIFYSSTGSFVMGYMLAVFAVFGGARWTASITILGLFIIDAIFVVYLRLKEHPEARRNPMLLLKISDKNHLHHRLLAAGYSHKIVMLVETAIMLFLGLVAFSLSDLNDEYIAIFAALVFMFIAFTIIAFLRKRNQKKFNVLKYIDEGDITQREVVVRTRIEEETKEDERFIY